MIIGDVSVYEPDVYTDCPIVTGKPFHIIILVALDF